MTIVCAFDTETTGLSKADRVISFGAVFAQLTEDKKAKLVTSVLLYNTVDRLISPGARLTHGIDNVKLKELSQGRTASDLTDELNTLMSYAEVPMGFNVSFDLRMLSSTYVGLRVPHKDSCVDVMQTVKNHLGSRMTLEEATAKVAPNTRELYRKLIDNTSTDGFHSARYDSFATLNVYVALEGYTWTY